MEILKVPQGEFRLSRYPARKKEQLRAWDAADEYLLNYFNEEFSSVVKNDKVLIVNDSFGAWQLLFQSLNLPFGLTPCLPKKAYCKTSQIMSYLLKILI